MQKRRMLGGAPMGVLAIFTALAGLATTPAAPARGQGTTAHRTVADALPAVVGIRTSASVGTGFVTSDGVLTAAHVVADVDEATVVTGSGQSAPLRVTRINAALDVALLVGDLPGPPTALQLHEAAELGDAVTVVTMHPFDGPILTRGIVSAFPHIQGVRLIQIDAAVNPGTSGGPILSEGGTVLGMVVAKDVLRDGVAHGQPSTHLVAFLDGQSVVDDRADAVGDTAPGPELSPLVPIGIAASVVVLLAFGLLRSRPHQPVPEIQITLIGPTRPVTPHERADT